MWWLAIPAVGLIGKLVIDVLAEPTKASPRIRTTLEKNLSRLRATLRKAGSHRIAILGQPGAGKSSLLKKMTGGKVTPAPVIGVETDATNWSDTTKCHLVSHFKHYTFIDVPGYDTVSHPAGVMAENFPFSDVDAYIFVVRGKLRASDETIFKAIADSGKPVCVARSFSDGTSCDERDAITLDIQRRFGLSPDHHIGFFSNRNGDGINAIFKTVAGC